MFEGFSWQTPEWLWGIVLPFLVYFGLRWRQKNLQNSYADSHLWPWVDAQTLTVGSHFLASSEIGFATNRLQHFVVRLSQRLMTIFSPLRLLALAWIMLILALAGPRSLQELPKKQPISAMDVMVVLDVSPSMAATDVYPSRFLQAKVFLESVLSELSESDRIGLVAFSGQAHLISPLSHDRRLFLHNLALLKPDLLPTRGSSVELGFLTAVEALQAMQIPSGRILLMTDGRNETSTMAPVPEELRLLAETIFGDQKGQGSLELLKKLDLQTLVLSVGNRVPTTIANPDKPEALWQYQGLPVNVAVSESFMQGFAQSIGANYQPLKTGQADVEQVLDWLRPVESLNITTQIGWSSYAPIFSQLALLFLVFAFYPVFLHSLLSWLSLVTLRLGRPK